MNKKEERVNVSQLSREFIKLWGQGKVSEDSNMKDVKTSKCDWKTNDVYAYQLNSEVSKKYNLFNHWLIFIVCDVYIPFDNYKVPIVGVKITDDYNIPKDSCEINRLKYIKIDSKDYDSIFMIPEGRIKNDDKYRNVIENMVLKMGELPIYYFGIYNLYNHDIPDFLHYIGNFKDIDTLKLDYLSEIGYVSEAEYIAEDIGSMFGYLWKFREENIFKNKIDISKNN